MSEYIGKILQEKLKEPGMPSVKDFADMLGTTTRTLYNVFNKASELSIDQVIKASEILKFDILSAYLRSKDKSWILKEPEGSYKQDKRTITINLTIHAEESSLKELPNFYKDVDELASRIGLRLV
ncbi:hypothetical protein [Mucilaginibacter sp.]|uniref:hypothetical protein n=1 Tax=Mucilaginibacter sp. TaxID=1882438 RepID=UPI0025DF81E5|nr:hypothetical protein [Mucilaginibacter sp.]